AADQVRDPASARPLALELGADDLVHEQKAVLLEADLDERGFHPGEDVVDDALVDVSGDRAPLGPLEVDLGDLPVLEDGDPLLGDVDRDEELALRGRRWRSAGSLGSFGSLAFTAGFGFATGAVDVPAAVVGFFRPRPPRLPRRRFFCAGCSASAGGAGASALAGSTSAIPA